MATAASTDTTEPRPQRADARRNRERILAAAREVFAKEGREVQMPDVARAAGVGVGTLYRHFPAKEDLVRALVCDKVQATIDTAREALTRDDPREAIEWLVHQHAAKMAESRGLRDAMSVIDFGDDNPWNTDEPRRCAASVLDRAREAGAIREDLTVDDWQALMCGLAAAIASGAEPARQADFILAAVRAPA
jgi:AcrR family transcriptional regulator